MSLIKIRGTKPDNSSPHIHPPKKVAVLKNDKVWWATGQLNLADRIEDCFTGQSVVVWGRKPNFGSSRWGQPFVCQVDCPVVRLNCSLLATAHDFDNGLLIFSSPSRSACFSILASFSLFSLQLCLHGRPIHSPVYCKLPRFFFEGPVAFPLTGGNGSLKYQEQHDYHPVSRKMHKTWNNNDIESRDNATWSDFLTELICG